MNQGDIVQEILAPLFGKYCWQAQKGYGSFLTFEFGNPHVDTRERNQTNNGIKEKIRRTAVHGDWHLWIYLCDWSIISQGAVLATSSSTARLIKRAMYRLDGQILEQAEIQPDCRTSFIFELDDRLETTPNRNGYGPDSELWHLYQHSGNVFTLRADYKYCYMPGNTPGDEKQWQALA